MDGREAMSMSGFYIQHRGLTSPHDIGISPPAGIRPMHVLSPMIGGGRGQISSAAFHMEPSPSPSPPPPPPSSAPAVAQPATGDPVKKKRGRPRKYAPEGTVALALSPMSSGSAAPPPAAGELMPGTSQSPTGKRGRGRPPGTGRKQQLASLGEWVVGSAGMGFTPHVIMIAVGEDIATKIMSFSQQGPRAICIISANGSISTVTLRQPATSGGTVTYEGRFEILSLTGSYLVSDDGGSRSRSGGLSISLSSPDGRVIGGGVGGLLIAASHVQVIVGSFLYAGLKMKDKTKSNNESGQEMEAALNEKQNASLSSNPPPCQNSITSQLAGGWHHGSRQLEMRNAHIDIDLTRG